MLDRLKKKKSRPSSSSADQMVSDSQAAGHTRDKLDEIEKARRDLMLACLESLKNVLPDDSAPVLPGERDEREQIRSLNDTEKEGLFDREKTEEHEQVTAINDTEEEGLFDGEKTEDAVDMKEAEQILAHAMAQEQEQEEVDGDEQEVEQEEKPEVGQVLPTSENSPSEVSEVPEASEASEVQSSVFANSAPEAGRVIGVLPVRHNRYNPQITKLEPLLDEIMYDIVNGDIAKRR